jgi:CheY-like chemotaxis protein
MFKILLVEDDAISREVFTRVLEHAGMEVVKAPSGEAALALLEFNPDLILMDLGLPGMSGFETARSIREQGLTCPIIAFSSQDTAQKLVTRQALEAGCSSYSVKPLKARDLRSMVQDFLLLKAN